MPGPLASSLTTQRQQKPLQTPDHLQPIPRPEDYDVSSFTGFLPEQAPLSALPDPYYSKWESIASNLQGLILSRRLRGVVKSLPILTTEFLKSPAEWRRAYVILGFITHSYIWGDNIPAEVIPPPLAIPFLEVCAYCELPPVGTYVGTTLWNWKPLFGDEPIDSLENLATHLTYTGSLDESWFYLVSVAIEARGAATIPMMLDAIDAARTDDLARVIVNLEHFAERVDELGTLLLRMYENCDPHVFYHRIRPFIAGSKNMADAGLPNGVTFDNGTGASTPVKLAGASNAQSSLIQFFDIVLGVEHRPPGVASNTSSSESDGNQADPEETFIHEMRKYMPGGHRRFLARVAEVANIREYVEARRADVQLTTAYDACLAVLRALRDKHIQMVSRYIVLKSRENRSSHRSMSPRQAPNQGRVNLATKTEGKAKGTGGTMLMPFLKQARDETGEPAIGSWARRLLTNKQGHRNTVPIGAVDEHGDGKIEIVGLAGIWSVDDSEGGICHW